MIELEMLMKPIYLIYFSKEKNILQCESEINKKNMENILKKTIIELDKKLILKKYLLLESLIRTEKIEKKIKKEIEVQREKVFNEKLLEKMNRMSALKNIK